MNKDKGDEEDEWINKRMKPGKINEWSQGFYPIILRKNLGFRVNSRVRHIQTILFLTWIKNLVFMEQVYVKKGLQVYIYCWT